MRRGSVLLASILLIGCQTWPWTERPNQLVLGSKDQGCTYSPDIAQHCCLDHDSKYWVGGTKQDRFTADAEFLACMALAGVPEGIAVTYYTAVRKLGGIKWKYTKERTRGPAR